MGLPIIGLVRRRIGMKGGHSGHHVVKSSIYVYSTTLVTDSGENTRNVTVDIRTDRLSFAPPFWWSWRNTGKEEPGRLTTLVLLQCRAYLSLDHIGLFQHGDPQT